MNVEEDSPPVPKVLVDWLDRIVPGRLPRKASAMTHDEIMFEAGRRALVDFLIERCHLQMEGTPSDSE